MPDLEEDIHIVEQWLCETHVPREAFNRIKSAVLVKYEICHNCNGTGGDSKPIYYGAYNVCFHCLGSGKLPYFEQPLGKIFNTE